MPANGSPQTPRASSYVRKATPLSPSQRSHTPGWSPDPYLCVGCFQSALVRFHVHIGWHMWALPAACDAAAAAESGPPFELTALNHLAPHDLWPQHLCLSGASSAPAAPAPPLPPGPPQAFRPPPLLPAVLSSQGLCPNVTWSGMWSMANLRNIHICSCHL